MQNRPVAGMISSARQSGACRDLVGRIRALRQQNSSLPGAQGMSRRVAPIAPERRIDGGCSSRGRGRHSFEQRAHKNRDSGLTQAAQPVKVSMGLMILLLLLKFPLAAAQPASLPQPAPLPSFNPLCDSSLVPCLDIDDFAAHAYAQLIALPRTEQRDSAAVIPYGLTLGVLGRFAGGVSTSFAFWQEERGDGRSVRRTTHGPLRLSLSALVWPLLPLRPSTDAAPTEDGETHYAPPRSLRIGIAYEHELRVGPFEGANQLGMLSDLAALRLVSAKMLGPVELTASLGALYDWRGVFATGEAAVQIGLYLPFFKAFKLYGEALGRGGLAYVQEGAQLAALPGADPLKGQGLLGLGFSFRPQARVDLGVSVHSGFGGLAPYAVTLRFAVLSVGKTYQGRAAAPLVELAAQGTAEVADQIRQYIESLPIDPVLDQDCVLLDDDGSVLGAFGKRSANGAYCEEDGFRVRIGEHFERPRKSKDRICRDRALTDCVLELHGTRWTPVHRPRLDGHCDLFDSDGTYLGRVGEPARDGAFCRQLIRKPNGGYGSSAEFQEHPIGELFFTDADRAKVCVDAALHRCFLQAAEGRRTLAVEGMERFAKRYDQYISHDVEQAHKQAEDVIGGRVSLTALYEEGKQAARRLAGTVTDPAKLREAATSRVKALGHAIEKLRGQTPDQRLDMLAHAAAEATESAPSALAAAVVPGGRVVKEIVDEAQDAAKAAEKARLLAKLGIKSADAAEDRALHVGAAQAARLGYHPAPKKLKAFPNAERVKGKTYVQGGGKKRERWLDQDGTMYEWDSRHGTIEAYAKNGRHKGEFHAETGVRLKDADPTRRIEP